MRRPLHFLGALALLTAGVAGTSPAVNQDGWTPLFNGRAFTGWTFYLGDNRPDPAKTFSVKDAVIQCTGRPTGYMVTEKEYGDYVLRVQWRWPVANRAGNSGVCVHVNGPDALWPKCVEAQGAANEAGDFWLLPPTDFKEFKLTVAPERRDPRYPGVRHFLRIGETWEKVGDAKAQPARFRAVRKSFEKLLGEWNQFEITCRGDTVKVVVNGQLANEGTG